MPIDECGTYVDGYGPLSGQKASDVADEVMQSLTNYMGEAFKIFNDSSIISDGSSASRLVQFNKMIPFILENPITGNSFMRSTVIDSVFGFGTYMGYSVQLFMPKMTKIQIWSKE